MREMRERDPERERFDSHPAWLKSKNGQFCSNEGGKEKEGRRSSQAVVFQVVSINLYLQLGRNLYEAVQQTAGPDTSRGLVQEQGTRHTIATEQNHGVNVYCLMLEAVVWCNAFGSSGSVMGVKHRV